MKTSYLIIVILLAVVLVFVFQKGDFSGNIPKVTAEDRYCFDSDGGIDIYTAGFVESDIGTYYDWCFNNLRQIREYGCKEGRHGGEYQVFSKVVSCGVGYECVKNPDGPDACVEVQEKP
mgnify:CR=1 FL=1